MYIQSETNSCKSQPQCDSLSKLSCKCCGCTIKFPKPSLLGTHFTVKTRRTSNGRAMDACLLNLKYVIIRK
jgi:hypothetical protein